MKYLSNYGGTCQENQYTQYLMVVLNQIKAIKLFIVLDSKAVRSCGLLATGVERNHCQMACLAGGKVHKLRHDAEKLNKWNMFSQGKCLLKHSKLTKISSHLVRFPWGFLFRFLTFQSHFLFDLHARFWRNRRPFVPTSTGSVRAQIFSERYNSMFTQILALNFQQFYELRAFTWVSKLSYLVCLNFLCCLGLPLVFFSLHGEGSLLLLFVSFSNFLTMKNVLAVLSGGHDSLGRASMKFFWPSLFSRETNLPF